uniref:Methyltransferase/helicase n=1 Tax=Grapevine leafroll-associated virus 3 TaxID=55951 RepID=A0A345T7J8_9CLOS|nr:methyltransferase/helicase [Grapevine leafroll-associated virus 3]
MDYVRVLGLFAFPHVNSTLEFFRFNKGNSDVNKFILALKQSATAKVVDFAPKRASYVYIGKLTQGVKRTFAPSPVAGYTRQFALVSGEGSATRADGEKVKLLARSEFSTVSDDTANAVVFEATKHCLLVVHYYRTSPFEGSAKKPAVGAGAAETKKPTLLRHSWRVKPTDVGGYAKLPSKPAPVPTPHQTPAVPTEAQILTSFGLFFNKGGGDEHDAIILRGGKLFNRALRVPVIVKNTFVWAKIWDEASRKRGYFYVKDSVVVFFPLLRGVASIVDFIVNTLPGSNVALPSVSFWCMRSRSFVHTSKGWCWFNNERLRMEIFKRRCFSSSFTVGFIMSLGFRSLRIVRFSGTDVAHIPSFSEERTYGWKPRDVYLPNVPRAAVVAGERTRMGGEILASVANALNQEEVYSSVVSSITNRLVLRDQSALLSHLDTKLCDMFSQRDAMIREKPAHRCDVFLKPQEKEKLRELFPELSIQFSDSVRSSHPFANAMRGCFNGIFSRRCGGVSFVDIGGSFTYHVKAGHVNCHVCNPVLDVKDVKRRINEILFLSCAGGDNFVSADLLAEAASKSVTYCSKESQFCGHRADAGFMVDVYDISPRTLAEAMDVKGCLAFDIAIMFPVELLYGNGEVYLEELDTLVKREGEGISYNVGLCGEVYEHSFSNVSGYFTNAYLRASSGNVYKLEYEGYRCGYHHITMCRAQKLNASDVTQRSIVPTFVGKSLVFIPVVEGTSVSFKSIVLDTDFVDRIYSYALNTIGTFENRTFEYAVGAIRSQKTHVITGSRVVHSKVEISPDDMWALVVSVMAQAIKDRAKSIRSYNFIKANDGNLFGVFSLLFQALADCFVAISSRFTKSLLHDNFNILMTLVSLPRSFIVRVPGSVVVNIVTSGISNRLELQSAFLLSKDNFNRRLRSSRLRVFSKAIVEDSIRVMKQMKGDDGKPLPLTEDSVYAFIVGNMSNVHCTRAGLLGGSKAAIARSVTSKAVNSSLGGKIFSGVSSFLTTGSLFVDQDISAEDRLDKLRELETSVNSPFGMADKQEVTVHKVLSGAKTFWSELSVDGFSAYVSENKKLIAVFTVAMALTPVAWKYRRNIARKTAEVFQRSSSAAGDAGLRIVLGGPQLVSGVAGRSARIVTNIGSSAVAVTRATVVRRQVPLALISLMTSYTLSPYLFLGMWAHVLPRHLMFFSGLGTLLSVRSRANPWTFGGLSNWLLNVPEITWAGRSYRSMAPQILLGLSLLARSLMSDSEPQLTYVPPIEGRNVYDEALRYYRDFDYDDGAGHSNVGGERDPGHESDSSSESLFTSEGSEPIADERVGPVSSGNVAEEVSQVGSVTFEYKEADKSTPMEAAPEKGDGGEVDQTAAIAADVVEEIKEKEPVAHLDSQDEVCVQEPLRERPVVPVELGKVESEGEGVVKASQPQPEVAVVQNLQEVKAVDKGKAVEELPVLIARPKMQTAQRPLIIDEPKKKKELCMFRKCSCGVTLDVFNDSTLAGRFSGAFTFVDSLKGRMATFFSKLGDGYSYVGGSHTSCGWPRVLDDILTTLNYPNVFDHCLVQKYRQGAGVPFHADDEECYPADNPILTVNLVGKASFSVKCRKGGKVMVMSLASGDHFLMPCGYQRSHLHSVSSIDEGRISLTFRATRRVAGIGKSLTLVGGIKDGGATGVPPKEVVGNVGNDKPVEKKTSKALSEGSARDVRGRSTYSIWCEQDYVKKCEWLRAENPVMALKPDYTQMTFEVVKTGTSEDAVIEYMKYLAIGIERIYRSLLMARNIAVVTADGLMKVPNQVYESLAGFHIYKSSSDLIYHPTMDGLRVRDLPFVFLAEKGIFIKGKDTDTVVSVGEHMFVCDDILVFHDAINLIGALRVARCGLVGEAFKTFDYKCYNAPPGGGKTTMLVDEFVKAPNSTAVITANVGSSEDINKAVEERDANLAGVNSATTVNSRVVNFIVRGMFRRILVDEVYMMHQGLLQLGVFASGATEGLFFGDINQIPFINREKVFRMDCSIFVPKKEMMVYTSKSYRCPLDVCYLLSSMTSRGTEKCYPAKVVSGKSKPVTRSLSKVPIGTTNDVAEMDADVYLCMTQLEKSEMKRSLKGKGKEVPVMTVHEAQGKTFGDVVLFRTKKADDTLFTKQPHILVALSRHTRSLVYAALSSKLDDKIGTYINDVSAQSVSDALLHTFAPSGCFRGL